MLNRLFRRRADLTGAVAALHKYHVAPATLDRLHTYLTTASTDDLNRLRAEDLAAPLALDEPATLELLAAAVHEGLLDLHWDVHCPACTGNALDWDSLQQATEAATCPQCHTQFDVHLDDHIAVRFSLNPRYGRVGFRRQRPIILRPDNSRVTGLDLLNVQAFRDLLTQQFLPAQESLRVSRITILFTDLRRSTALYAQRGDPPAYSLVREHFDVLFSAVQREHGALIKTIGDSIMATFTTPGAALRAGLAIQRGIAAFNRSHNLAGDDALMIKIGIHTGPSIAVTMNGRMDYFGTAVNIAARVEGLAQGDDLAFTEAVLADPDAAATVQQAVDQGGTLVSFTAPLRGLRESVPVHRLSLPLTVGLPVPVGPLVPQEAPAAMR